QPEAAAASDMELADCIASQLAAVQRMTRTALAKALEADAGAIKRVLESDPRFVRDARSWRLDQTVGA
ncbi:MAG: hypothetical protein ACOCXJ_05775, partial [Planctomycetota bacterium]